MNGMSVRRIKRDEAYPWLLEKHYAKRIPIIMYAFGLYENGKLCGVCTYGLPPSRHLCVGICGNEYADNVLELNRLVLQENKKNSCSFFVAKTLKSLPRPSIVISYADSSMNHNGYIYQAANFLYVGLSAERKDPVGFDCTSGRHSRGKWVKGGELVERPRKHRYVYFVGSKKQKKEMANALNYEIQPYPKGENSTYDSGGQLEVQGIMF